jgi:tetratricopeptide (TPR) repeat protein
MTSKQVKEEIRQTLLKVGEALKGGNTAGRTVVLRCANMEQAQMAHAMLPRAFPRVKWLAIMVEKEGLEAALMRAVKSYKEGKQVSILLAFPGEVPTRCIDAKEAEKFALLATRLALHKLPAVLVLLAPSVRVLADKARDFWKAKAGYLSWPDERSEAAPMPQPQAVAPPQATADPDNLPAPEETQKVLESLQGEKAANYLCEVAGTHMQRGSLEHARMFLVRAVQIYSSLSNLTGMAMAYHMLGLASQAGGDNDTALSWLEQAVDNRRILDDRLGISDSLAAKGHVLYLKGQYEQAARAFDEAKKIDEELGHQDRVSAGLRKIAMVFELRRDFASAADLYAQSLEIEKSLGSSAGTARVYNHLGRIAEEQGKLGEAEAHYTESLKLKEEAGDRAGTATSYHHLGNLSLRKGDQKASVDFYRKAIEIEKQMNDRQGMARTLAQLGIVHRQAGRVEDALMALVQAYQILLKLRSPLSGAVLGKVEEIQGMVPAETFNKILREAALAIENVG